MKKLTTVLLTLAFVLGVTAMASAACFNCAGDAGNINRGCDSTQTPSCAPFDFENPADYCNTKTPNRALFKICDCLPEIFSTLEQGDTIDISLEILVDSGNGPVGGDNGVYWAENVDDGIGLGTYNNQADACDEYAYGTYFAGPFRYLLANGTAGGTDTGTLCDIADADRVVKIVPDRAAAAALGGTTGYLITPEDDFGDLATWAIDIPMMRVDNNLVNAGDKVWVKICLSRFTGGICEELPCCCEIYIGELCCPGDTDTSAGASLVYPYFPPANSAAFNLIGMTITNLSALPGDAVITMYESDGDVGTLTVNVPATGIYLNTLSSLVADPAMVKTGAGTLGDSKSYITVKAPFNAEGFVMIADTIDGASMGYLAK